MSETTIFVGENNLSKTVILTEKRMVNLTNNYKFIVTNKNTVTSDSNFNLSFLVMVTGQLLQCKIVKTFRCSIISSTFQAYCLTMLSNFLDPASFSKTLLTTPCTSSQWRMHRNCSGYFMIIHCKG